jgi:hypothetical protein
MAKTQITDVIVPSVFEQYVIERTAAKSAFVQSGIVENSEGFDARASGAGNTINMPFWVDLTGDDEGLSDAADLATAKITASQDVARIQHRGKAWSTNLLAELLSGSDPMAAIGNLVGTFWARQLQKKLIASLKGVFLAASMSGNASSIFTEAGATAAASNKITGVTFIDALQKLGDANNLLSAIAMHSDVEASLKKLDLIDFVPDSEGKAEISTFQGRRVIVDDSLPKRAGTTSGSVYTSYIFGQGAFALGNGDLGNMPVEGGFGTEAVEIGRVPLASDTLLINRRRFILHPRGVKWTNASVAGSTPTVAELETGANWERVYENKNVRIVQFVHNI